MRLLFHHSDTQIAQHDMKAELSKKVIEDREKSSSFECGFDPKRSPPNNTFYWNSSLFYYSDITKIALTTLTL